MAENITDLLQKQDGDELSAEEFVRLIRAVRENQSAVRTISLNGSEPQSPDADGNVDISIALGDYEQILTVKYNGNEVAAGNTILSADGNVTVQVQYKESAVTQSGNTTNYEPTGQIVTLTVNRINSETATTETLFTRTLSSVGHDSTEFVNIPLAEYLGDGSQQLQFRVTNTINASPVQKLINVVKANLKLSVPASAEWFAQPHNIVGDTSTSHTLTMRYFVVGQVAKTLYIRFDGSDSKKISRSYTASQSSETTAQEVSWTETASQNWNVFTHGVHTVEAWLECTVSGQTVTSNKVTCQIIVVADGTSTAPLLALSNLSDEVVNYDTARIFDFMVYNPANPAGGTKVALSVANSGHTVTYFTYTIENAANNTIYPFNASVEIESSVIGTIQAAVFAAINDVNYNSGNSIHTIDVDNSVDYSPTSGADFYMNPRLRNNSETNKDSIVNSISGNTVTSSFTGFSWLDGVDGWIADGDGRKCLRILAGSKVEIDYNAFSAFIGDNSAAHSLAIELDFAVRNITNEEDPIILMGNGNAANPVGVYMMPLNGAFSPASVAAWLNKDISWQEGVRTHVIFDIQHDYVVANPDTGATAVYPIIRTFINGVINRECPLSVSSGLTEVTANTTAGKKIIIGGNTGCDIDIYGIRVYKKSLSESEVRQNRLSGFSTGLERLTFLSNNDILNGDIISFAKAKAAGLNCIVWHGTPVNSRTGNVKKYGYAEIYRFVNGEADEAHSGNLYGIVMKGQGTTAMNYAEWNFQFQDAKDDATVLSPNNKREFVPLSGSATGKFGYRLESSDPLAKKLVGKVNYASSMQSHKEGACNLYNDLYRLCVTNSITNFNGGERVTVKEEPFLFFIQQTEGSTDNLKVFQGLCTFGPGKADKPTWGVSDADLLAGDSILEGSDNNNPLTDMRVPFTDDGEITYSEDKEAFMYNGEKNLNFDFGDTADLHENSGYWEHTVLKSSSKYEVPTKAQVKLWQPIINFLYLTNVGIKPWEGTPTSLNEAAQSASFDCNSAYWMTAGGTGYSQYDLYRCKYTTVNNTIVKEFVPAGIRLIHNSNSYTNFSALSTTRNFYNSNDVWTAKDTNNNPIALNMQSAVTLANTLGSVSMSLTGSWSNRNLTIKNALCIIFRYYVDQNIYIHKQSALFHHETMKLWAGTDNRSKNTYYRFNTTLYCMEMNDDDLDTIFKTNNIGFQSKPYYALEHDVDGSGATYWEGQDNALNNTLEAAYSDALIHEDSNITSLQAYSPTDAAHKALVSMMNSIFTAMVALAGTGNYMNDGTPIPQSVYGCFMKYFLSIQKYFPAVAYNETARIRYEPATVFFDKANAIYQSLGDQYESEAEYIKRRLIFLSGYAEYVSTEGILQNRGYGGDYQMALVPHFYLFPTAMSGASISSGSVTAYGERIAAGETCNWTITTTGDTTVTIFNAKHMRELGNLRKWPTGKTQNADTTFSVVSDRLVKFECYYDLSAGQSIEDYMFFRASQVDLHSCVCIEEINIRNAYTIQTFLGGLTDLIRLKKLDARGSALTTVSLPQTTSLTELRFPKTLTELSVQNCPNLSVVTFDGFNALTTLSVTSQTQVDTYELMLACYNYNYQQSENVLTSLTLVGIDWSNVSSAFLEWLLTVETLNITGHISMASGTQGRVGFSLKKRLIEKFGNVDDPSNPLYIEYTQATLGSVAVSGDGYFDAVGEIKHYDLIPNVATANTIKSYSWALSGTNAGMGSVDALGNVTCLQMGTEVSGTGPTATLTCTVTLVDNTTLTDSMDIRFYFRQAKVGDFVYHDGTWDDRYNASKDVIGICFYSEPLTGGGYDRRMVALKDIGSYQWGLYNNGSLGSNGFASSLRYDLDGTQTAPFDIDNTVLPNYTTTGGKVLSNTVDLTTATVGADNSYVRYGTMIDPQTGDFYDYSNTVAFGIRNLMALSSLLKNSVVKSNSDSDSLFTADSQVPVGLHDTLAIIWHRNRVLAGTTYDGGTESDPNDDVNYEAEFKPADKPTTEAGQSLSDKILAIRNFATNTLRSSYPNIYSQYLYPAASAAFAYEPTVSAGNELDPRFKAHHWYLPSSGELARLCYFALICNPTLYPSGTNSYYVSRANGNPYGDIFANAVSYLGTAKFTRMRNDSLYWSSTEYNAGNAWYVYFLNGGVIFYGYYGKFSSLVVRACAAF